MGILRLFICVRFVGGFVLPEFGLERFCMVDGTSHDVYVLAEFDSYDGDMNDNVKGQVEETLETNNVASDGPWQITDLDCSGVIDVTQNRRRKEKPRNMCNV